MHKFSDDLEKSESVLFVCHMETYVHIYICMYVYICDARIVQ